MKCPECECGNDMKKNDIMYYCKKCDINYDYDDLAKQIEKLESENKRIWELSKQCTHFGYYSDTDEPCCMHVNNFNGGYCRKVDCPIIKGGE